MTDTAPTTVLLNTASLVRQKALEALAHAVNLEEHPDDGHGHEVLRQRLAEIADLALEVAEGVAVQ